MKYQFIHQQRTRYPIVRLCSALPVSRSGYYEWRIRKPTQRAVRHTHLTKKIFRIHGDNRQVYGSPRVHKALLAEGECVGINTVAKLMQRHDIQCKVSWRFKLTTQSKHRKAIFDNHLNREFAATAPNEKWVSDVTCIPTGEGHLYLATLLDLYSRKLVGWSMSPKNDTQLALGALEMALLQRGNPKGLMLHSANNYKSPDQFEMAAAA